MDVLRSFIVLQTVCCNTVLEKFLEVDCQKFRSAGQIPPAEFSPSVNGYSNLCDNHRIPGTIALYGESTMVIAIWVVEHRGEAGFILLNDYALGELFGGRGGFDAKLVQQGFRKV